MCQERKILQGMKDKCCEQQKMRCAVKNGTATVGMATQGLLPVMPSVRSLLGCPGSCPCNKRINWDDPEKQVKEWKEKEKKACEERDDEEEDCENLFEDEKDDKDKNKDSDNNNDNKE